MPASERAELIRQYMDGASLIDAALDSITDQELDSPEAPGEWSPRQVIHHLADSETQSTVRLRRLLAEDDAIIQGYDQDGFAARLHYDRDIAPSLALFRAVRAATGQLLGLMSDEDWRRSGTHSESGPYSAEEWLRIYAEHAVEHAAQIRRGRAAAG
ncbi:MAG TPA: DinB family protein [Thermomicrobiales bacterium]|jgi:hypothetical protein|nr:DinB family protein [Thermomicrobiales bacterium]